MRQAAVVGLSLTPFLLSTFVALVAWELLAPFEVLWRLIAIVLLWIVAFAGGTQLFWKAVGMLSR